MNWRRALTGVVAVSAAVALVLVVRATGLPDVRATVASAGPWGPLLFVLLSGLITLAPVPRTVFTVAAGVLFGSVMGVLLSVVGTTCAAVVAFWLVRLAGGRLLARHTDHPAMRWLGRRLDRSGLLAVMSLRLIPMVPFAVLNYAAGLSGVRFWPYAFGTVLGILPGTVAVVVLGDAATGGTPHPVLLVVSLVCGAVGVAGAALAARPPRAGHPVPIEERTAGE